MQNTQLSSDQEKFLKNLRWNTEHSKLNQAHLLMEMRNRTFSREQMVKWWEQQIYVSRQFWRCMAILAASIDDDDLSTVIMDHFVRLEYPGSTDIYAHPTLRDFVTESLRKSGFNVSNHARLFACTEDFITKRMHYCKHRPVAQVLGALAYGTELVNKSIFADYLPGMSIFEGNVSLEYFSAHTEGEEEDFEILEGIIKKLALVRNHNFLPLVREGARDMIQLRQRYFDFMAFELSKYDEIQQELMAEV